MVHYLYCYVLIYLFLNYGESENCRCGIEPTSFNIVSNDTNVNIVTIFSITSFVFNVSFASSSKLMKLLLAQYINLNFSKTVSFCT